MTDRFTIEIVPSPVYEIELTGRGPQGIQGPKGDTGATGPAGPAGPQGPKGDRGDSALTFTVGDTTELPTSNSAYVENVGTGQDIVLDFGIPRGLTGASGKGVDIGTVIQSLSKVAPDGFVHTWGESISQEENPELYQACLDGTLPTVNASNGGVSTIYAPNGIFKQTAGTNTLDINTDVVIELAKIGGVVDWNGSYNPQPTGSITLASLSQNTETQILMFTEGGQNEVHFRFLEGSYSGKLAEAPSNPTNNTLYFNTTDKTYYIHEGGDWNQYGASGVGYIYLGGIIVTSDPSTATWDNATFVSTDVTTTGLSEYDQQLVANKGNCGYFGLDTTELSVRVPTMQNVFLEENDTEVGNYKEAGLPNITASFGNERMPYITPSGALYWDTTESSEYYDNPIASTNNSVMKIDASRSNPIYGNSDTVQPEAIAVYFYVCVSKYTQLEQGPYFTPHVDENGVLSWTNNGGLVNPPNIDIKGPKGDNAFTLAIGEVTTLPSGSEATVTNVGTTTDQVWDISIPRGETVDVSDKANVSLDNLNNEGMNIANWSTNVTNCISEIPQDIKLEMVNGIPTLRAGSKCYIPNGFEEDGVTPRFDEHITQIDLSFTGSFGASNKNPHALVVFDNDSASNPEMDGQCVSGPTPPTTNQYCLWYDTANNIMKWTTDKGATWTRWNCSLPVGLAHYVGTGYDGGWEAIDQVFNGMGYFGSTLFVTKGVKSLIPNGRNEDGSLNNIEYITKELWTYTSTQSLPSGCLCVGLDVDAYSPYHEQYQQPDTGGLWLDTLNNYMKRSTDNGVTWEIRRDFVVAFYVNTNGVISNFQPKQPFRAVDYSDKSEIAKWGFPDWSKKTDQAVNTTHTTKSQGWIIAKGITSNNEIGLKINDTYVAYAEAKGSGDTSGFACLVPINIGQTYISTGNVLTFIPCQG